MSRHGETKILPCIRLAGASVFHKLGSMKPWNWRYRDTVTSLVFNMISILIWVMRLCHKLQYICTLLSTTLSEILKETVIFNYIYCDPCTRFWIFFCVCGLREARFKEVSQLFYPVCFKTFLPCKCYPYVQTSASTLFFHCKCLQSMQQ